MQVVISTMRVTMIPLYIPGMENDWHPRFVAAIKRALADGITKAEIRRRSGANRNMVTDILEKGTIPSVENYLKICEAIEADPIEILTGTQRGPYAMKALRLFAAMPEDQQRAFLDYLATLKPGSEPEGEKYLQDHKP